MKILIVIDSLGPGGAEKSMVELGKFLKNTKHEVLFLCQDKRKINFEDQLKEVGIGVDYFENKKFFGKVLELASYVNKCNPDIIHSVLVGSNLLLRMSRLITKKGKVIQSLVSTPYSLERKKDSKLPWQKFLLAKQIDKWTARVFPAFYHSITQSVHEHYKTLYNIRENFKIIHRGRFENPNQKSLYHNEGFTLINVGRQQFAKGQINILKALKYIEKKYGVKQISLEILGINGQYSKELKEYVVENDLDDRVIISGYVDDVENRLIKASAFIFPSYYEGLGGALIEAFAAKLPCICSDLPVLREVVGSDQGALFCFPGDYECLGEQIFKLYSDIELQKNLSNYSYSRFQEKFRSEKINEEMLNMYHHLLNS